jgi:hypothetical protein
MAGVPNATLQGWKMPAQNLPSGDHVYVTSTCGLQWGCFGRDSGGYPLVTGTGSSILGDCLSNPIGWVGPIPMYAGIWYAVTGVCHQAANRILYAANQTTVSGCRGWALTLSTYGIYGLGPWNQLMVCGGGRTVLNQGSPSRGSGGTLFPGPTYLSVTNDRQYGGLGEPHAGLTDQDFVIMSELSALVRETLGDSIDAPTFRQLVEIQVEFKREQARLIEALQSKEISPEAYLQLFTKALTVRMAKNKIVLGNDRFYQMFGEVGDYPEYLADPEIFFSGQASNHLR